MPPDFIVTWTCSGPINRLLLGHLTNFNLTSGTLPSFSIEELVTRDRPVTVFPRTHLAFLVNLVFKKRERN